MSEQGPYAVLDVGSNTIRLLVARLHEGKLQPVDDQSEFVRLGRGVDKTGELDPDRQRAALQTIATLAGQARSLGADGVVAIATSAVRDAANGERFAQLVKESTGVELEIISGEREAYLTYMGATLGIPIESGAMVCDLGGGSAELIHADKSGMRWATSVPLGSGRLTERFLRHDPPTAEEQDRLAAYVRSVLEDLPAARVEVAILTGGTATHLAWLAGRDGMIEHVDSRTVEQVMAILSSEPASEIVSRYDVKPERAQVLPAGVRALQTLAQYYAVDHIVITRHGIREGTLIDYLQHASKWPERRNSS